MLSSRDLVGALITNLKDWTWDINNDKFVINKDTGSALLEVSENTESVIEKMCDNYCKFPQKVHEEWLFGKINSDRDEYLLEHYCNHCPLKEVQL